MAEIVYDEAPNLSGIYFETGRRSRREGGGDRRPRRATA